MCITLHINFRNFTRAKKAGALWLYYMCRCTEYIEFTILWEGTNTGLTYFGFLRMFW